jgi:class I lanthipeptide synthase
MSDASGNGWRPLLSGEARDRTLAAVEEIAGALRALVAADGLRGPESFSLADGHSGLALFFAYLHLALGRDEDADLSAALLERAIDAIGMSFATSSLYSGFPGVAWTAEHLQGRLFDPDGTDPGRDIADAVAGLLRRAGAAQPSDVCFKTRFDLINGWTGLGVYALERWPRAGARECLDGAVGRLVAGADRSPDGIAWWTPPDLLPDRARREFPAGYYNLGVAHGLPGAIGFLAGAAAAGSSSEASALLPGAVRWLLRHRLPPGSRSAFPHSVGPHGEPRTTRLSWCYGDLGIAAALLAAARHTQQDAWEREALELARRAAARVTEAPEIKDACLCHGTAGVAHLFNRLFQASGDPALGDAARFWALRTLEVRQPGVGIAGFSAWRLDEQGREGWRDDPGLLNGAAGVGLALLAAATGLEPAWDRVMLTSIPQRAG